MSRRKIAVTVGVLFFAQMATAMVGTSLIQAFVDGNTERAPLTAGVLLGLVGYGFRDGVTPYRRPVTGTRGSQTDPSSCGGHEMPTGSSVSSCTPVHPGAFRRPSTRVGVSWSSMRPGGFDAS